MSMYCSKSKSMLLKSRHIKPRTRKYFQASTFENQLGIAIREGLCGYKTHEIVSTLLFDTGSLNVSRYSTQWLHTRYTINVYTLFERNVILYFHNGTLAHNSIKSRILKKQKFCLQFTCVKFTFIIMQNTKSDKLLKTNKYVFYTRCVLTFQFTLDKFLHEW